MTSQTRTVALIAALLVAIFSIVVIVFILRSLKKEPQSAGPQSEDDLRRLIEAANVGVAHLENHDTVRSTTIFTEIAANTPEEPLGPRNLAVALVVAMGDDFQHATPPLIEQAQAALESVQKREGATVQWHWLSARVAMAEKDFQAAEEHLVKITDEESENASAWFELFQVRQASSDAGRRGRAWWALESAFKLRPRNLFVLVEYLRQLEARLAEREQTIERLPESQRALARRRAIEEIAAAADLAAHLRAIRETLLPFRDRLMAISRVDVIQLMDEALAAADLADTRQLSDKAGQVARLTLGVAATDLNQIRKHALEFVIDRFTPEFYERLGLSEAAPAPAIDVSFVPSQPLQLPSELQEMFDDILSVALVDFDLDGRLDVVVLDASGVYVFARTADSPAWRQVATAPVAARMGGLVVQDLDLDFDETPMADNVQGPKSKDQGREKVPAPKSRVPGQEKAPANVDEVARGCPSADVEVVAYGPDGVVVLENRYSNDSKQRELVRVEQPFDDLRDVRAATAVDLDGDGDLDLVFAANAGTSLWSNRGNGTFENISVRSSLPPSQVDIIGLVALDWDRDMDVDVLVGGASRAGWLENIRHGQMRWREFSEVFAGLRTAYALAPFDADGNASWDLLVADRKGIHSARTLTPNSGVVRALDTRTLSDLVARGLRTLDYDNDGMVDVLAWSETAIKMYRGLPNAGFRAVGLRQSPPGPIKDCDVGDLDADGDLDLVLAGSDRVTVFSNEGGNKNHWLDVSLKARQIKGGEVSASGRVNAHGVGSLLELKAGDHYQTAVVRGQTTHFGLGTRRSADTVRVMWLNGVPQNIVQPGADQAVCELQVLTGSCPYLYVWNGTRFEFLTDLLWAAPLGLQAAEGVLLPSREWEYLKIPGERLAAKNGEYVLQITEELWEAAYFDEVKLIAVDHPANVEIFSNEKVGPAEIAQFKVHTARERRQPVSARNHRGRDLLGEIAEEDGVYSKPFDTKLRQGLAEDHFIEIDLGDLDSVGNAHSLPAVAGGVPEAPTGIATSTPAPERHPPRRTHSLQNGSKRITLFLTGWIYPGGTSINVAVSQNPELTQPKPPALLVPDGNGGWKEALPYMGFPGGKTKTIAVDLSGIFTGGDYRLRIATNFELYWDQIFFTVGEPEVEVRLNELEARSADLHWRGLSQIVHPRGNGPEHFVYDRVTREPKWPPMKGRFTRYGDVLDLVRSRDDRLLILGAGDEATLRFTAPADPPPGWKRDFLLYSVGWDKDANLCTVLGETVEPLPFRSMTGYPPLPGERPPASAEYQNYLRDYQTRAQDNAFWRAIRSRRAVKE